MIRNLHEGEEGYNEPVFGYCGMIQDDFESSMCDFIGSIPIGALMGFSGPEISGRA